MDIYPLLLMLQNLKFHKNHILCWSQCSRKNYELSELFIFLLFGGCFVLLVYLHFEFGGGFFVCFLTLISKPNWTISSADKEGGQSAGGCLIRRSPIRMEIQVSKGLCLKS